MTPLLLLRGRGKRKRERERREREEMELESLSPPMVVSVNANTKCCDGIFRLFLGPSGFPNSLPPWDDPAIVTAANVSKHFNNNNNNNKSPLRNNQELRGNHDEQPHWMKSLQVFQLLLNSVF